MNEFELKFVILVGLSTLGVLFSILIYLFYPMAIGLLCIGFNAGLLAATIADFIDHKLMARFKK